MSQQGGLPSRRGKIWLGIIRLARFRADGLEQFGHTPAAFLNSLAPLLAFPLVSGLMVLLGGAGHAALVNVLVSVIALLAPIVISYYFARLWGSDALWLRYAIAFNWCEAAVFLLLLLPGGAMVADRAVRTEVLSAMLVVLGYWLVLQGFLARSGLRVSVLHAVVLVLVVNLGAGLLLNGPWLVALLLGFARGG